MTKLAAASRWPSANPASTSSTIWCSLSPFSMWSLGGEAHLRVDDPVVGEVLGRRPGHATQRVRGLRDAHRVREGLEVALQ